MFNFSCNEYGYFITCKISTKTFTWDDDIIKLLSLSEEEYKDLLLKFNAYERKNKSYYFLTEDDTQNCCDYLNEKYNVLFKLICTNT